MDKIKVLNNQPNSEFKSSTGLAPVIGYEPWVLRTIESCKESILAGHPLLIRLHSGSNYTCENSDDTYRLDMESHSVLVFGFDDDTETFDILDPWREDWKGNNGGVGKLSYEILPIVCVNATAEKTTRLSLPEKKIIKYIDQDGNASLSLEIGHHLPKGYIIDKKQSKFTSFDVQVAYNHQGTEMSYSQKVEGSWDVGATANIEIPLGKNLDGNINFSFLVKSTLQGERPYRYEDKLQFTFEEKLQFKSSFSEDYISQEVHNAL